MMIKILNFQCPCFYLFSRNAITLLTTFLEETKVIHNIIYI